MTSACEKCGAALSEEQAFCTGCGTRRSEPPKSGSSRSFCVSCGGPLDSGAKFCVKCGTPVQTGTPKAGQTSSESRSLHLAGPSSSAAAPPAGGSLMKVILFVAALVAFFVILTMGSCAYIAYRAKQKVHDIEQAYEENGTNQKMANKRDTGSGSSSSGSSNSSSSTGARPDAPYGWTLENGKLVPAQAPKAPSMPKADPVVPVAATGNQNKDWALRYERTENGPEADLVVRTGDINNLGFGWPQGFDPFSGESTPPHQWPDLNHIPQGAPDGTDRVMIGTAVIPGLGDGYSGALGDCMMKQQLSANGPLSPATAARLDEGCKRARELTMPAPIVLDVGALPAKINTVLVQMFVDDFQPIPLHSHFQISLNGTRIPNFEYAINALDQSGPIGKLLSFRLLPEYWSLLQSGTVKLLVDDPTTHVPDGYAIDFVRILVNPHNFKYQVSLTAAVTDADKHTPIPGATVTAALESAATDQHGKCQLNGLPAGLVIATGAAPGYDENSVPVDLVAGHSGNAEIQLHRHKEDLASLEQSVAQTGSVNVYGIHFDTGSAKLRADSLPALQAVLGLINGRPGSNWIISGHTDNQGTDAMNLPLSEARAASVRTWLTDHGVAGERLQPKGFGASRPVADNATANGRALNRRVEIALATK